MKKIIFGMVHTRESGKYTPYAINSFLLHTGNSEIFLIDNDNEITTGFSERVKLIKREKPHSFAENANFCLKKALDEKADLFFLNNDIVFTKNWLEPFKERAFCVQTPACNMQYQYGHAGLNLEFSMTLEQYLGKENIFDQISAAHCQKNFGRVLLHTIPYYCIFIPYEVLKVVGLFDTRYSPYGWEDTDYTVRCYREGIPVFLNANSFILHFYGKSTWNRDGKEKTTGDKHCAEFFVEKWGKEIADIFGFQTPEGLGYLNSVRQTASIQSIKNLVLNLGNR